MKRTLLEQAWWLTVVIALGRLKSENCYELEASQGYIMKFCSKQTNKQTLSVYMCIHTHTHTWFIYSIKTYTRCYFIPVTIASSSFYFLFVIYSIYHISTEWHFFFKFRVISSTSYMTMYTNEILCKSRAPESPNHSQKSLFGELWKVPSETVQSKSAKQCTAARKQLPKCGVLTLRLQHLTHYCILIYNFSCCVLKGWLSRHPYYYWTYNLMWMAVWNHGGPDFFIYI